MKKILLIGASGNLGSSIKKSAFFLNLHTPSKKELDLLDKKKINNFLRRSYDIIINCSGFPRIKKCEENILKSFNINYLGVKNLVLAISRYNSKNKKKIRLIHLSSDAVYSCTKGNYSEKDQYSPKTIYAICKVMSEIEVKTLKNYLIIRTRFFNKDKFKFKDAATNIYSSMIEVKKLVKIIYSLTFNKETGVINVGESRNSDYNIYKKYFTKIKRTSRNEIQKKFDYFITKDASLNLKKFRSINKQG